MARYASVKLTLLLVMLLAGTALQAQQTRIRQVRLEKRTPTSFRVRYDLEPGATTNNTRVQLEIVRRRGGVVETIFSEDITGASAAVSGGYQYTWTTDAQTVRNGDELRASIRVEYERPVAVAAQPVRPNLPPRANAGKFADIQLPVTAPIVLDAGASTDPDGRIVRYSWRQIGGPQSVQLRQRDSARAMASGAWKEGTYAFELAVYDNAGASDTDRVVITVRPAAVSPVTPPAVVTAPRPRDTAVAKPTIRQPEPVALARRMRGGPSNALVNLLVPGLGHYYVSGDADGADRKKGAFLVTALYLAGAGGAVYFKTNSDQQYRKYLELADSREYQRDASGNVIGVRAGDAAAANEYLRKSQSSHRKFLLSAGAALSISAADFAYTLVRGMRNRAQWMRERRTSFILLPQSTGWSAGVRLRF